MAALSTPAPDEAGDRFETAIRETVDAIGGVLLFQQRLGEGASARWAAAVAMGEPGALEIVIIELPDDGDAVRVSPASESTLPIASIASAYAGLAECWRSAA